MMQLCPNGFRLIYRKKILVILIMIMVVFILGIAGCQTSNSSGTGRPPAPPVSLHLTVHGKVHNIDLPKNPAPSQRYLDNGVAVLFMPHRHYCSDSTGSDDAIRAQANSVAIKTSGKYAIDLLLSLKYSVYAAWEEGDPCITAFVIKKVGTTKNPIYHHNYRVLAGPKKLGADFDSHFRSSLPYDSVRVDFTVQDSTKRAADDSTME